MTQDHEQHSNNGVPSTVSVAPSTATIVAVPALLSLTTLTLSFWNNVLPFNNVADEPEKPNGVGGGRGWHSPQ